MQVGGIKEEVHLFTGSKRLKKLKGSRRLLHNSKHSHTVKL